jgi:hypothetical protein
LLTQKLWLLSCAFKTIRWRQITNLKRRKQSALKFCRFVCREPLQSLILLEIIRIINWKNVNIFNWSAVFRFIVLLLHKFEFKASEICVPTSRFALITTNIRLILSPYEGVLINISCSQDSCQFNVTINSKVQEWWVWVLNNGKS